MSCIFVVDKPKSGDYDNSKGSNLDSKDYSYLRIERDQQFRKDDDFGDIKIIFGEDERDIFIGYDFYCRDCNLSLPTLTEYSEHREVSHSGQTVFFCNNCPVKMSDSEKFKTHLWTHDKSRYSCSKCGRSSSDKFEIKRHIRWVHLKAGTSFKCGTCGKVFLRKRSLTTHMTVHMTVKPFQCDQCDKSYTTLGALLFHKNTHHSKPSSVKKQEMACEKCDRVFRSKNAFDKHKQWHEWKSTRDMPEDQVFLVENTEDQDPFDDYVFKCRICEAEFENTEKKEFVKHMISIHKKKTCLVLLPCNKCEKSLKGLPRLKKHLRIHSGKKYACSVCGLPIIDEHHFKKHKRVHTGEDKKYVCNVCEKRFVRRHDLDNHMYLHSDKKPFPCALCDKSYTTETALDFHVKNSCIGNANKKMFTCDICLRNFCDKEKLQRHIASHEKKMEMFNCTICSKSFKVEDNFKRHLTTHEEVTG